jgi:thiol-disulfide isomerase/thioredoxin
MTAKIPDSIIISADVIISKAKENNEVFKYVVSHITSTYERSKIMGMDAVFVHMVEKYYMKNLCPWIDSTQLEKIIERAEKISPNLIGKKAPEFVDFYGRPFMKDLNGTAHTIESLNAKYTLLVFYGPTCGHCKKEVPKIKNAVDSLKNLNIDIKSFAVATEFDVDEWKKFLEEQKIEDWLNVADISFDDEGNPLANSDWRDKYDIYSTPVVYLLDKEKRILAKRINHDQLKEIILRLEDL